MNLRFRLNLIVTLVLLIILMLSAMQAVTNARNSVHAELVSAMEFALHMLDVELRHIHQAEEISADNSSPFKLERLTDIRHLRIAYYDRENNLIEANAFTPRQGIESTPNWFRNLMHTTLQNVQQQRLPVYANGTRLGELVVTPEPESEISEAWEETKMLLLMISLAFLAVNVMVYLVVAHALQPVTHITRALSDIESGRLETRLPIFRLPEMAQISQKFNTMASTMENSIRQNHRLTQRIIQLQERERKSLAQELHDEIGQHLTAIHVDASVIEQSTDLSSCVKSARAIDEVACHMMTILRSLLKRLRPGGLDELSFVEALQELVNAWQERQPRSGLRFQIQGDFNLSDESIQLTLYRALQECLTNISRHSGATQVRVILGESETAYWLEVADNGKGFDRVEQRSGFGISGMQQRVESVDGKLEIDARPGEGTTINVNIPKQGEIA